MPIRSIPHSHGGSGQHGPDEHGLGLMAGIWWDIGARRSPAH